MIGPKQMNEKENKFGGEIISGGYSLEHLRSHQSSIATRTNFKAPWFSLNANQKQSTKYKLDDMHCEIKTITYGLINIMPTYIS